tara:strand:+ start:38 stop:220 length:183 start_codon:yes stop_codon:yes gene_type:complete
MKIDGRLKQQSRTNQYGKIIYIHKIAKNNFAIGINGTSKHESGLTKKDVENELTFLTFYK